MLPNGVMLRPTTLGPTLGSRLWMNGCSDDQQSKATAIASRRGKVLGVVDPQQGFHAHLSRRSFTVGAGSAAALLAVPGIVRAPAAHAGTDPLAHDTLLGLMAFVMPGNDAYSRHQRESTSRPGGVNSGNVDHLEKTFNEALPFPFLPPQLDITLPGAAGVSALLNLFALQVDPTAAVGPFLAPFSRLDFVEKTRVFKELDTNPVFAGTPAKFIVNAIPTLAAFLAFSEASKLDRATDELSGRPVGWELTSYPGVSDGWDEFLGYYRGVD